MSTAHKDQILKMTELAILTAIVILLQCFGGMLRLPFMGTAGNLVLIPIAIGAILLGPGAGAWLGLVCGVVIYLFGVTGADPFTHILFTAHPVITALICLVKTTLGGALAALVYRALVNWNRMVALFTTAILVPVVNTGVFVLGCFTILETLQTNFVTDGGSVIAFIFLGLAGVNFLFELGLNLVFTPAIERIINAVRKLGGTKKRAR